MSKTRLEKKAAATRSRIRAKNNDRKSASVANTARQRRRVKRV